MVHNTFIFDVGAKDAQVFLVKSQIKSPAHIKFDFRRVIECLFLLKHLVEKLTLALEEDLRDVCDQVSQLVNTSLKELHLRL